MKIIRPNVTDFSADLIPQASGTLYMGTEALAWGNGVFDSLQVNTSPSGPLDVTTKQYVDTAVLGENLWDRTGTTLTTYFSADTVQMDGYVDWAGGNTWYLPIGADINAFIASASCVAGDTIQLASGTYTITDDIDIAKSINIRGQGIGRTVIACATDGKNVFDISASNVRIADLSISCATANAMYAIKTTGNITGIVLENLDIDNTAPQHAYGIFLFNTSATLRDITIDCTVSAASPSAAIGLSPYIDNESTTDFTVDVYNVDVSVAGGATSGSPAAFIATDALSSNTVTANLYNCAGTAGATTGSTDNALTGTGDGVTVNAYECVFNGADADVSQANSATVNVYSSDLVNGTTSGTITYAGFNSTFKGGNIIYVPQGSGTNDHTLIESYIAKAKAGDTLVLAGGDNSSGAGTSTYVIADDIDVGVGINIVGQGVGKTTISCATASKNVFDISADDVRIAGLSISTTFSTGIAIKVDASASTVFSGIVLEDLDITMVGTSTLNCIQTIDTGFTLRNTNISVTSSGSVAWCVEVRGDATAEAAITANIYNLDLTAQGTLASFNDFGIRSYSNSSASDVTVNVYNSSLNVSDASTAPAYAVETLGGARAIMNVYGCKLNGEDYDVINAASSTLTLYDTTLVNNTTSGTITYGGTVATAGLQGGTELVINDSGADSNFRVESDGIANMLFVDGGTNRVHIGDDGTSGSLADFSVLANGSGKVCIVDFLTFNDQVMEPTISIKRSHNDTIGTLTETIDTEYLGTLRWQGVDSSSTYGEAFRIGVTQKGASGAANVPAGVEFKTYAATGAGNANQLHLDGPTGTVSVTSTSVTNSALLIDANGTTGATGEAAVRIDSENTDTAALYITSAVDGSGSSGLFDDYALVSLSEGLGGAGHFYRSAAGGSVPIFQVYQSSATGTGKCLNVNTASNATADSPVVNFETTDAAHDQPVLQVTQAGTGSVLSLTQTSIMTFTGGTDWYQKWSDGFLILQTDEGTNTASYVQIKPKGTGESYFYLFDGGNANYYSYLAQYDSQFMIEFGSAVTEFVINENSRDVDFRVESDGNANMLFVDGGTDNVYFNQNARVSTDDSLVQITATKSGNTGNLLLCDAAAMAQGVGGQLTLWGNYTGSTATIASLIAAEKTNSTDGQYGFDTVVYTRINGVSSIVDSEVLRLGSTETVFNDDSCDIDFRVESANVDDAFKIDAGTDTASFGVDVELGNIEIEEDAGEITLVNMSVTSAAASGTPESYSFQIDDTDILKVYAEADGAGGIISQHTQMLGRTVSTNFQKIVTFGSFTLYVSDGTTAEGALTGTEGDICLNGGTGAGQMAYCDADGTNWTDM